MKRENPIVVKVGGQNWGGTCVNYHGRLPNKQASAQILQISLFLDQKACRVAPCTFSVHCRGVGVAHTGWKSTTDIYLKACPSLWSRGAAMLVLHWSGDGGCEAAGNETQEKKRSKRTKRGSDNSVFRKLKWTTLQLYYKFDTKDTLWALVRHWML